MTEASTVDLLILSAPLENSPPYRADRVIILEPESGRTDEWARVHPAAEIIPAVLAGESGPATLVVYDQLGLRAFAVPRPELRELLPGLIEIRSVEVTRTGVKELLSKLGELPDRVALHLECPGEEAAIVKQLNALGVLSRLAVFSIRCGCEPFFEGSEPAAALAQRVAAAGLREIGRDLDDPDFPVLRFARPPRLEDLCRQLAAEDRAAMIAELKAQIGQITTEAERARDLQSNLDMLQGDIEDLRARYRAAETARAQQAALLADLAPCLREVAGEQDLIPVPEAATGPASEPALSDAAPIRLVHHFACTGGTLISRAVAVMPNVTLLSEIDPLSPIGIPARGATPPFRPHDLIFGGLVATRRITPEQAMSIFTAGLGALYADLQAEARHLVLRDHAHSHFCTDIDPAARPTLAEIVARVAPVLSAVTVRHPVHSYLSLRASNWTTALTATIDSYARRYHAFLDACRDAPVFRYEDLTEAPDSVLERICEALALPFRVGAGRMIHLARLSGNSGRTDDVIAPRPTKPVPDDVAEAANRSTALTDLCARLGYDDPSTA